MVSGSHFAFEFPSCSRILSACAEDHGYAVDECEDMLSNIFSTRSMELRGFAVGKNLQFKFLLQFLHSLIFFHIIQKFSDALFQNGMDKVTVNLSQGNENELTLLE